MKQIFALLLCLCLLFSLCACTQVPPEDPDMGDTPLVEPLVEADLIFVDYVTQSNVAPSNWPHLLLQPSPDLATNELITTVYTDSALESICSFAGSLIELNEQYPIECVRVFPYAEEDIVYRACFRSATKTAILRYDTNGNKMDAIMYTHTLSSNELEAILCIGQMYEDVKQLVPSGRFVSGGYEVASYHVSSDGYYYYVNYRSSATYGGVIVARVVKQNL
ncbi:MAG: hypothetical protein IJW83_01765 [Clostridia bacterium]|nr:hypothetical protein [Clostridia bacterium]